MSLRRWIAPLAAAAALLAATGAHAQFADVYSAGHADVNIAYQNNTMILNYEFGANAVINGTPLGSGGAGQRSANSITTLVGLNGFVGSANPNLPAPFAGNPIWILPQTSAPGRPFLGIGAEGIDPGVFVGDLLTLRLSGFAQRPAGGEFIVWQNGNEANPFMNSANGITAADSVPVSAGSHDHYNWGFTRPGIYDIVFTGSGILANNQQTVSVIQTYRFNVVPEPSTLAMLGLGLGALVMIAARRRPTAA